MENQYEIRTIEKVVQPQGKPLFDERSTHIKIDDEGGGEYVRVTQTIVGQEGIAFDADEWPMIRNAIDEMVGQCREYTKEKSA